MSLDSTALSVIGVHTGVSRTFHDLGFPAHTAQEQLFARHLRNHDCANAARPPQHSLSSGTLLTAHAGDSPAKSCQRSWHGEALSLWQFLSDVLRCCGGTSDGETDLHFYFLI